MPSVCAFTHHLPDDLDHINCHRSVADGFYVSVLIRTDQACLG